MIKNFFVLFLVTALTGTLSAQQTSGDLKKKQAEIQKEIDDLKRSLDETKKYKKEGLAQYNLVQKKIRLRENQINNINQQINYIQGDINQSGREITKLHRELDTLKMQYEKSVVYSYKNRSNYDFLNFIFSAGSFNDALKRVAYLKSYRNYREEQADNIQRTQQQLQKKITSLNENKLKKSEVLQEQSKQMRVLEDDKKEKEAVVSKLKSREKEITKDMNDKRKQDLSLRSAIKAAINREIAKEREKQRLADLEASKKESAKEVKTENASSGNVATVKRPSSNVSKTPSLFDNRAEIKALSDNFEKNRGNLPWPISAGNVSMHFGRQTYIDKINIDNPGITIESSAGSSVKAVFDGEVSAIINVGPVQGVILKHGKYFTTYSNLSSVSVSKGQQVKMGQVLGKLEEKDEGRGELEFLITNDKNQNENPERWLR